MLWIEKTGEYRWVPELSEELPMFAVSSMEWMTPTVVPYDKFDDIHRQRIICYISAKYIFPYKCLESRPSTLSVDLSLMKRLSTNLTLNAFSLLVNFCAQLFHRKYARNPTLNV